MKFLICFAAFAICAAGPLGTEDITTWEQFKQVFNKQYESAAEEALRRLNFENALKFVLENRGRTGIHELGIHENSDLSPSDLVMTPHSMEEMLKHLNSTPVLNPDDLDVEYAALPASFDWRKQTQFNPVENQGSCGSCWAFATTATVEAQLSYRHKTLVRLSKQELVDCAKQTFDSAYRNLGCQIGYPDDTYQYMVTKGLHEEKLYPYNGNANEACYTGRLTGNKYHVQSHYRLANRISDESIMNVLHQYGPTVVVIHGTDPHFQQYKGGIIRNLLPNSAQVNHVVAVVGWGTENGVDYWIIRNSWGVNWGEQGHARIERHNNNVAFNNWVSYPVLS